MEIVVAQSAGFCWGVFRAFDVVDAAVRYAAGRKVVTLGPIIHNPGVIASLEARGVSCVDPEIVPNDQTVVVIRAHGLPQVKRESLATLGDNLVDATCPFVARVERAVADAGAAGRLALLVGDENHAEFRAARTYTKGDVAIVAAARDVATLPKTERAITVIAQTTLDRPTFDEVVEAVRARFTDVVVENTRCDDTRDRQAEAERMAHAADVVLVVGGKNSANTARLASIAEGAGAKTYLIETTAEIDRAWFKATSRVVILGGASTPRTDIDAVAAALETMEING
ncbi:MAG: 4-hydroxy-3-methylbut-2-enyl diphosphate reductase [Deltaproteobacteria bacterium]|nr:4-hydroxy-3-methylbut-2-enyl diphosphate reductase [Deltaproteobacteria bacterium]